MECSAQSAYSLYNDLCKLGFDIGADCQGFSIILEAGKDALFFKVKQDLKGLTWKEKVSVFRTASGKTLSSEDFFNAVKEIMQLPEGVTYLKIEAKIDEIVTTTIMFATPIDSLNFLKDYTAYT